MTNTDLSEWSDDLSDVDTENDTDRTFTWRNENSEFGGPDEYLSLEMYHDRGQSHYQVNLYHYQFDREGNGNYPYVEASATRESMAEMVEAAREIMAANTTETTDLTPRGRVPWRDDNDNHIREYPDSYTLGGGDDVWLIGLIENGANYYQPDSGRVYSVPYPGGIGIDTGVLINNDEYADYPTVEAYIEDALEWLGESDVELSKRAVNNILEAN